MRLLRFKKTKTAVMGVMKDDTGGTYFTIENASTLIPSGLYRVQITNSPRFGTSLPLLSNDKVSASRGIRIHGGNLATDSKGCICVGNTSSLESHNIGKSQAALKQLLAHCGSSLEIEELE